VSGAVYRWTSARLRRAREILGEHRKLENALEAIADEVGFDVSRSSLDSAFTKAGFPTPMSHLKRRESRAASPIPPVDARDTEQMPFAKALELPDDSGTTVTTPESPSSTTDLAAHRQRLRISELESRTKRLLEELAAKDDELANFKTVTRPPRPIVAPDKVNAKQRKATAVLLCSDWHVEEEVRPETVNGLNTYNLEIADRCIERLADGFEWMLRDPRFDIRSAVIAIIGDLLSGYIHDELVEGNLLSPPEALVWLIDRIEAMVRKILATCPDLDRIIVPCHSGNHGRTTEKQRVSSRESNSFEQVIYQTLRRLFRDEPRIEFHIATGEWSEVDVMGFTLAFTHGDSFQSNGGVGGISIPIKRGITRQFQGRDIHQFNMGHFHQRTDFGNIQVNGSMIGYAPFSQRIHAAFEPRQQSFYLVDSERGKCVSAPIWL
jgi:hypothetical protein